MAVILFYSPFDQRARDAESLMIAFRNQGHQVISLSQAAGTGIHPVLNKHGIETFTYVITRGTTALYYLRHVWHLVRFCRTHRVEIIYAHLEPASFAAVLSQFFIAAKVYVNRHHVDEAELRGFNRSLSYRLTYLLAQRIIVVSARAKAFMIEKEGVKPEKIFHVNLGYDFSLFAKPDPKATAAIRTSMGTKVILLTVCRLTRFKRPEVALQTLKKLTESGVDASLIILGRGEEESSLVKMTTEWGLQERVLMPGHVTNVSDYLGAADFLVHPSVLESSCVIVKEAALVHLPVVVCEHVGDFDEYLRHLENGFVVRQDDFSETVAGLVREYADDKNLLRRLTDKLYDVTVARFGIDGVLEQYDKFNKQ